jgi:hypothetical protein
MDFTVAVVARPRGACHVLGVLGCLLWEHGAGERVE